MKCTQCKSGYCNVYRTNVVGEYVFRERECGTCGAFHYSIENYYSRADYKRIIKIARRKEASKKLSILGRKFDGRGF